jgi:squalene-hopene/tetraprenyl-beta-curcumene cyclase
MTRQIALTLLLAGSCLAADWNPKLAADYLDARQQAWAVWPQAMSADGACVSCHTGMTYLLARPALRRLLGETQPTEWENKLRDRLRAHAGAEPAGALQGVETVFAALFITEPEVSKKALDQLWTLQIKEGKSKGAWPWYNANLDPWETPASPFYGASLAAMAIGSSPARNTPEVQARVADLRGYLDGRMSEEPLHNRLALLWASTKLPEILSEPVRKALIAETLSNQAEDGGWAISSLGPWGEHKDAVATSGSNTYATAFAAYVLLKAGVAPNQPAMARALTWVKAHQDAKSGAWPVVSMNKKYPAGSMEQSFLQDAATSFSVMALVEAAK